MRISDWSSDVCSSDLAVAGPHERNCNSRAARFLGPHRATCSQSLDIVASVLSSRWVSRSIAPTSGGAQGDRRAEPSLLAVAINQDAAPRSQHDTRSEEHTSEIQSLMRNSYTALRLKKKKPL